jgi:hypothetical protein
MEDGSGSAREQLPLRDDVLKPHVSHLVVAERGDVVRLAYQRRDPDESWKSEVCWPPRGSILPGHRSVTTTERNYAKWAKGRQDRLGALVSATGTKYAEGSNPRSRRWSADDPKTTKSSAKPANRVGDSRR